MIAKGPDLFPMTHHLSNSGVVLEGQEKQENKMKWRLPVKILILVICLWITDLRDEELCVHGEAVEALANLGNDDVAQAALLGPHCEISSRPMSEQVKGLMAAQQKVA